MIVTPIQHGITLAQNTPGYVRSPGLHMSTLYNSLFAGLEPKRFGGTDGPDPLKLELGMALEEGLETSLKTRWNAQRPGEFVTAGGIIYSPDFLVFNRSTRLGEIKLTWMSSGDVPRCDATTFPPKFDKWLCIAPATRVLTSDLRWIAAEEVRVGDSLIGFDEIGNPKRHMRHTRVQAVKSLRKLAARLDLVDGSSVECSLDHQWFIQTGGGEGRWERTDHLLATDQQTGAPRKQHFSLCRVVPQSWGPSAITEYSRGWLAGIFDGEGSLGKYGDSAMRLTVAQREGAVWTQIQELLRNDHYRAHFAQHISSLSGRPTQALSIATQADLWRFLAVIRPVRLLEKFRGISNLGGFSYDPVRIEKRVPLGRRPVVAIQTDTRTFVADGFASHNCQMKCYCYHLETPYARLLSYFVNGPGSFAAKHGPELLGWDFTFTARELQDNWQMVTNNAKHVGLLP